MRRKVIIIGDQSPASVVKKYAEYAPIREMGASSQIGAC
jgi:hypothetical protein